MSRKPPVVMVFAAYISAVFLLAALSSYPLYQLAAAIGYGPPPFAKFCLRLLQCLAIVGLWPMLRGSGLTDRSAWGFGQATNPFYRDVLEGLCYGIATLGLVAVILVLLGVRNFNHDAMEVVSLVMTFAVKGLLTGLLVALIEELWFRGALHSLFAQRAGFVITALLTSSLYAAVHYVKPDVAVPADQLTWTSGFQVLMGSFDRLGSPAIVDSALALFCAGLLLAVVRQLRGNIAMCIGIHAGWVMVIRVVKNSTVVDHQSPWLMLVGSYDFVVGYLAVAVFSVFLAGYWWSVKHAR